MTVLALIVVLGVLIFVHELGHFLAAKSVDIRVERFSIGLGPKVLGFQRGETEYILAAIPLGGYVKMGGMDDEVMDKVEGGPAEPREPSPRDFDSKPLWARAWVISAGVLMNMLFAFGAYTFIAGNWGDAHLGTRQLGMVVVENLPEGAAAMADIPLGAEIVRVGDVSITHWDDIADAFINAPAGPIAVRTEAPSSSVTVELGSDPADRVQLARSLAWWMPAAISAVEPGSPADDAGLRANDQVIRVGDLDVETWYELERAIRTRPGLRTELTIERDGQRLIRAVTPSSVTDVDPETGEETVRGRAGIFSPITDIETVYEPVGLGEAMSIGWSRTVLTTRLIGGFLRDLVTLQVSPRSVGSIVAIGEMSGQAAERGLPDFLSFMAMFSVNLAILNLLPIPVLDGGHLVFLLIEAVRGRALSIEQRMRWSQVGLVVILGIMVLALSNDFRRLFARLFDT